MRPLATACGALAALVLATVGAHASDDFTGMYKAIDAKDGSVDRLSITGTAGGSYEIVISSTGLGHCDEGRGPGFITSIGRVVDGRLVREKGVATCTDTGETILLDDASFVSSHDGDVLTIEVIGGRINRYHRISD